MLCHIFVGPAPPTPTPIPVKRKRRPGLWGPSCCARLPGAPARLPGLRRCARLAEPARNLKPLHWKSLWLPKDSMPRRCIGELAEFLFKHRGQSDTSVNKECSEYAQRVGSSPAISASLERNWRTMGFQELYKNWVAVVPCCPCTQKYSMAGSCVVSALCLAMAQVHVKLALQGTWPCSTTRL
jgi:hypothetical protein